VILGLLDDKKLPITYIFIKDFKYFTLGNDISMFFPTVCMHNWYEENMVQAVKP